MSALVQVPPVDETLPVTMDMPEAFHNPEVVLSAAAAGTVDILQCVNPVPFSKKDDVLIEAAVITKFVFDWVTKIDPDIGVAFILCVPLAVIGIWPSEVNGHCVAVIAQCLPVSTAVPLKTAV